MCHQITTNHSHFLFSQVDEYQKLCDYSENLEENWGKPPGNLNSNGQELLVFGKQFGNVFIGVQVCVCVFDNDRTFIFL